MRKKYLSALLFGALVAAPALTFTSCNDYDDDISGLNDRIEAVESLTQTLQSQIQQGAVITNVQSTANGVAVTLSNGDTFELTNGKDGADGADGTPGTVWTIGEDGFWYCDGEKTDYPSKGDKGDKGDPGEDGTAGSTGSSSSVYYYPGTTGEQEGKWIKVTVDAAGNETSEITNISWVTDSTGSATTGVVAVYDGDTLTFSNVEGTESSVVIYLTSELKSMVFKPEFVLDGQNALEYVYIPYKPYTTPDTYTEGQLVHQVVTGDGYVEKTEPYKVANVPVQADSWVVLNPHENKEYHLNPSSAVINEYTQNSLAIISNDADFVSTPRDTRTAASNPQAKFVSVVDGIMTVGITMDGPKVKTQELDHTLANYRYKAEHAHIEWYPAERDITKITDMALTAQLENEKNDTITSTYASIFASQFAIEAIAYNRAYAEQYYVPEDFEVNPGCDYDRPLTAADEAKHDDPAERGYHLYPTPQEAAENSATILLAYNDRNGVNLNKLVYSHAGANSRRSWNNQAIYNLSAEQLKELGMKYEFTRVPYSIGENATEQSQNHCIIEDRNNESYIVACGVKSGSDINLPEVEPDMDKIASSIASVGRTPLIQVALTDTVNNKIVKLGYIKFKIYAPEVPTETELFNLENFFYQCGEQAKTITWHAIEQKLLDAAEGAASSKETFDAMYHVVKDGDGYVQQYVKENGTYKEAAADEIGIITENADEGAETTDVFTWTLDRADFVHAYEASYPTYPEITQVRYVKYIANPGLGNTGVVKRPIFLPIQITLCYPKGIMSNKIPEYWYADNSMAEKSGLDALHANVEVPATATEQIVCHPTRPQFRMDLDSRFYTTTIGHVDWNYTICWEQYENAPIIEINEKAWAYEWNKAVNFEDFAAKNLRYYYYFTAANDDVKVTGLKIPVEYTIAADGTAVMATEEYTLSVHYTTENIPVMLYGAGAEYANTVLYATGSDGIAWPIAYLHKDSYDYLREQVNFTGDDHRVYMVVLNNPVAKAILNLPESWAEGSNLNDAAAKELLEKTLDFELGVAPFNRCDEYLPLTDHTFDVEVLKPVYEVVNGEFEFIDAYDGGTEPTRETLADIVKFYDWRVQWFNDNLYYYHYYGVDDISVNPKDIMIVKDGKWIALEDASLDFEFHVYRDDNGDGRAERVDQPDGTTPAAGVVPANATWEDIQAHFGELGYTNNTGTVVNFDILVPVKIHHYWSPEGYVVWVKGHVGRSLNN